MERDGAGAALQRGSAGMQSSRALCTPGSDKGSGPVLGTVWGSGWWWLR